MVGPMNVSRLGRVGELTAEQVAGTGGVVMAAVCRVAADLGRLPG
jgi:hypothetical protein